MPPTLVIAEKAMAARRLAYLLKGGDARPRLRRKGRVQMFILEVDGEEHIILGLSGHIVELDYPKEYSSWERVRPEDLIHVEPEVAPISAGTVSVLRELAGSVDTVIIATDYDREGELIGVESMEILRASNPRLKFRRARFSALIRGEVERAFRNLQEVDLHQADAARARQVIDLAWGAVLTRQISLITSQRGRDFLSVGRVQTPTLALIVRRERDIDAFVPEPFWRILGDFAHLGVGFRGEHAGGRIDVEGRAREIYTRCREARSARVVEFSTEEEPVRPPVPFDTTGFLAELGKLRISPYRGMEMAEELYMKGYISYPRTDNTVYPRGLNLRRIVDDLEASDLRDDIRRLKKVTDYVPTRGRREATDHPPIHPTSAAKRSDMRPEAWKVYELVVRRFMATLAPPARVTRTDLRLDVAGEPFVCRGEVVREKGWLDFYPYTRIEERVIPELKVDQKVDVERIHLRKEMTRPPPRYSESRLLKEMDRLNLGTKSTRHEIIQKLHARKFIEGRSSIRPTPQAMALITSLESHAGTITSHEMTAFLEEEMDGIAQGKKRLGEVVEDSRSGLVEATRHIRLHEEDIAAQIRAAIQEHSLLGRCRCGGSLRIVSRGKGGRFVGCTRYPECGVTHPLPAEARVRPAGKTCSRCGLPVIRIQPHARTRPREECIDYQCETSTRSGLGVCPKCRQGTLTERRSRAGKRFVSCSRYPECRNTYPLPAHGDIRVIKQECGLCGAPIVRTYSRRGPWDFCLNMECPSKKRRKG